MFQGRDSFPHPSTWTDTDRQELLERLACVVGNQGKPFNRDTVFRELWKHYPEFDPRPSRGRIYFARSCYGGPIKIGTSYNLERRLMQLNVASVTPLCFLATMPGWREEEAKLHAQFSDALIHSEWYEPSPELMELIWAQDDSYQPLRVPGFPEHWVREMPCSVPIPIPRPHPNPLYQWVEWTPLQDSTLPQVNKFLTESAWRYASGFGHEALGWLADLVSRCANDQKTTIGELVKQIPPVNAEQGA